MPNSIVLRGSGNGTTGYGYLSGRTVSQGIATGSRASARPVEITILGGKISVKVDYGAGYVTEINEYDLTTASGQAPLPPTLKLGFSGSTGGSTNNHEIRDLTVQKPADLSITMSADKTIAGSGEPVVFTVVAHNGNINTANGLSVLSSSPGFTYGAWTSPLKVLENLLYNKAILNHLEVSPCLAKSWSGLSRTDLSR